METILKFLINPGKQQGPAGKIDKADVCWIIRHSIVWLGPTILLTLAEISRQLLTIGKLSEFDPKIVLIILVGGITSVFSDFYLKLKKDNTK